MSLLDYLRRKRHNTTASIAKERLQIIISHERTQQRTADCLPKLQEEIIAVIAKYLPIDKDKVSVNLEHIGDNSVLELNITMPDKVLEEAVS